jgi:hypothetical protein
MLRECIWLQQAVAASRFWPLQTLSIPAAWLEQLTEGLKKTIYGQTDS